MANPFGANQFDRQPAHGEVKRLQEQQKAAPLSGAPISALHAPRRSQRHATGQDRPRGAGRRGEQQQVATPPVIGPTEPSPEAAQLEFVATAWERAAAMPGASDLVKQYAKEAREAVGFTS